MRGGGEPGRGARPMPYEPIVSGELMSRENAGHDYSERPMGGGGSRYTSGGMDRGIRMRGGRGEMRMRGRGMHEGERGMMRMPRGGGGPGHYETMERGGIDSDAPSGND